jgi:hypothetical protein
MRDLLRARYGRDEPIRLLEEWGATRPVRAAA